METKEITFDREVRKRLAKGKRWQHKLRHRAYRRFYKYCMRELNKHLRRGISEVCFSFYGYIGDYCSSSVWLAFDTKVKRNAAVELISRFIKTKHPYIECDTKGSNSEGQLLKLKLKSK